MLSLFLLEGTSLPVEVVPLAVPSISSSLLPLKGFSKLKEEDELATAAPEETSKPEQGQRLVAEAFLLEAIVGSRFWRTVPSRPELLGSKQFESIGISEGSCDQRDSSGEARNSLSPNSISFEETLAQYALVSFDNSSRDHPQ